MLQQTLEYPLPITILHLFSFGLDWMQVAPRNIVTYYKRPFQIVNAKFWHWILQHVRLLGLFDTAGQLLMLRRVWDIGVAFLGIILLERPSHTYKSIANQVAVPHTVTHHGGLQRRCELVRTRAFSSQVFIQYHRRHHRHLHLHHCYGYHFRYRRTSFVLLVCWCDYCCFGHWIRHWQQLNSSPPSAACTLQWMGSTLVKIMVCRLFGAKSLSKPML